MQEIISKTQEFLCNHLMKSECDQKEVKYRYDHSLRVANIGLELAELENADKKIIVLACLLHDVAKFDTDTPVEHGRISARVAKPFLETLNLSQREISDTCYAIASHVDGKCGYEYQETLEGKIVSDADKIDRFGAHRICQQAIWDLDYEEKTIEEKMKETKNKLEKLRKYDDASVLQTKIGNSKFKEKLRLQIYFYDEYLKELRITKLPCSK
ncbi:MAG: phosphohydrolase [Alkaliphilus sp.]|nr:HD domain-containing protein [bacterium AH-315-L21]PHS29065.1 MAG: phosphohydrolase [Alkaliphilus sp.]